MPVIDNPECEIKTSWVCRFVRLIRIRGVSKSRVIHVKVTVSVAVLFLQKRNHILLHNGTIFIGNTISRRRRNCGEENQAEDITYSPRPKKRRGKLLPIHGRLPHCSGWCDKSS